MFSRRHDAVASSADVLKISFTSIYADVGMIFQKKAEVSQTAGVKVAFLGLKSRFWG